MHSVALSLLQPIRIPTPTRHALSLLQPIRIFIPTRHALGLLQPIRIFIPTRHALGLLQPIRIFIPTRHALSLLQPQAVVLGDEGLPSFDRLRYHRRDPSVILVAFDLIELNGDDLRRDPIEKRKAARAKLLSRAAPRIQLNEHIEQDGPIVFEHVCKLGFEGIVSKRKGSRYSTGRSPDWLKSKNPASPAVRREAEEDWRWRR
jgi:hypothetical protein